MEEEEKSALVLVPAYTEGSAAWYHAPARVWRVLVPVRVLVAGLLGATANSPSTALSAKGARKKTVRFDRSKDGDVYAFMRSHHQSAQINFLSHFLHPFISLFHKSPS